ncbi:hypothetical protein PQQ51_29295, partial [Paraburkholderia xenovorans]
MSVKLLSYRPLARCGRVGSVGLSLLLSCGIVPSVFAQAAPADPVPAAPAGWWDRSTLFGDMGGLRPWLGNYGVSVSLQETSEYLGNLSGG